MEKTRLKIKIGDFEFEAEGSEDSVQEQFQAFKELVINVPVVENTDKSGQNDPDHVIRQASPTAVDDQLDVIMNVEDRVVSLTVPPEDIDDAILLIMLGQKRIRSNDSVTGSEIIEGLRMSGQRVARVDRLLERIAKRGEIIVIGQHRAKRYRLTNRGLSKARESAKNQIALVA